MGTAAAGRRQSSAAGTLVDREQIAMLAGSAKIFVVEPGYECKDVNSGSMGELHVNCIQHTHSDIRRLHYLIYLLTYI